MKRRGYLGREGYCEACGESMPDGPDVCLGWIPGVSQACCGHGNTDLAFVYLGKSDGAYVLLKAELALEFFALVKQGQWVDCEAPATRI